MKTSAKGLEHLKQSEGSVNQFYIDFAEHPTIGVGHLLTKSEMMAGKIFLSDGRVVDWRAKGTLTDDEINMVLADDLQETEQYVEGLVDVPLNQNQFDALVSFVFNIGPTAFKNSTLLRRLNEGDYSAVPVQMKKWIYAGGRVQRILEKRREREIKLWNGE